MREREKVKSNGKKALGISQMNRCQRKEEKCNSKISPEFFSMFFFSFAGVRLMENFWIYFQNTLPSWAFGIHPFSICRDFCLFHFDCAIYFTLAQLKRLIVFGEGVARCRPEMSQCYRFTKDNNQIFFVASDVQVLSESKLNERGTMRITFSLVPKQLNLFSVSFSTGSHFIMKFCGRIHSFRSRFLDTIFFFNGSVGTWFRRGVIFISNSKCLHHLTFRSTSNPCIFRLTSNF